MRVITATAVALALAALTGGSASATGTATAHRPSVDGFWRMDGYGTVLSIRNGTLQEFQTTAVSCIEGDSARRTGPGGYTTPDGTVITVRPEGHRDHASMRTEGSVGDRKLRRIGELPEACTRPAPDGPIAAFDVFWQSFEENYPFFSAKGIDWHAVREQYRPTVDAKTTEDELFDVFSDMVRPLNDAHVAVRHGDSVFAQVRPGTTVPTGELDTKVKKFIVERDLKDARNLQEFANGRITYADLPDGQGYLRISGFGGYAGGDTSYAAQLAKLDTALDAALGKDRPRRLNGLIIDLRINGGGSDALGIHIAERLTDTPYVAYAKRARNDPTDPARHTRPQPAYVIPAHGPRHTGPIAVLTGGSTFSAGETFTQALMDRPGRTFRIGQPTQGVFSDVMVRKLPGGMSAFLPNEEFLTASGRTFDGTGIPPHLTEPVFTREEFDRRKDSAFDRAVNVLRNHGGAVGGREQGVLSPGSHGRGVL
ncbi:S41 family peptidase [Streptomyces sp. CAI-121]|uniref:S41 family peptidase n=1 Tax=unclassified Streptomyces TaxID=2593676 RepID=UPI001587B374|nr:MULTISPECIES: S41 family peptidase [unclassified Streptomyces]NUV69611.1 S41 family peptidase [Streptomyces sp. CAI-121]NUW15919.1 S41 family peptidase [Streptomyces sp. CAI-68]